MNNSVWGSGTFVETCTSGAQKQPVRYSFCMTLAPKRCSTLLYGATGLVKLWVQRICLCTEWECLKFSPSEHGGLLILVCELLRALCATDLLRAILCGAHFKTKAWIVVRLINGLTINIGKTRSGWQCHDSYKNGHETAFWTMEATLASL